MNDENRALTMVDSDPHALTTPAADQARLVWSVDLAIDLWLDSKFKHSI